jgi:hypothetical protein
VDDTLNLDSLPEASGEEGKNANTARSEPEKLLRVGYIFPV